MVVKTYRGLLADGVQEKIPLATKDGSVGYRITKFQVMSKDPGINNVEGACKIYKVSQTSIDGTIDFSDNTLLAAVEYHKSDNQIYPLSINVIFEQEIFNQDIYITWDDNLAGVSLNYYIELEQMKLDHTQNMTATLKAIRGSAVD